MKTEIEKAIWYIEENLTGDLSLNDVARYCKYSPFYLSVLFQQTFGETMKSYTKKRRLTRAAEALRNTDMKIIGISMEYGADKAVELQIFDSVSDDTINKILKNSVKTSFEKMLLYTARTQCSFCGQYGGYPRSLPPTL